MAAVPRPGSGVRRIFVLPVDTNGYGVALCESGESFSLFIGGMEFHPHSRAEALEWFRIATSTIARLRIEVTGIHPIRWALETANPDGTFRTRMEAGRFSIRSLLQKKKVHYLQNAATPEAMAGAA